MNTTKARFELGSPDVGVIDFVSSKKKATEKIVKFLSEHKDISCVEVYDCMAQIGNVQLWIVAYSESSVLIWTPVSKRMQS